jgi:hypothetical protein
MGRTGSGCMCWLGQCHSRRRWQAAMRCGHGLGRRTAAVGLRHCWQRFLACVVIYQRRRCSRRTRWRRKIMGGSIAVIDWLLDCKHPRVYVWQRRRRLSSSFFVSFVERE